MCLERTSVADAVMSALKKPSFLTALTDGSLDGVIVVNGLRNTLWETPLATDALEKKNLIARIPQDETSTTIHNTLRDVLVVALNIVSIFSFKAFPLCL